MWRKVINVLLICNLCFLCVCDCHVVAKKKKVNFSKSIYTVYVGEKKKLTLKNNKKKVQWSVNKKGIIFISKKNRKSVVISAKKVGRVQITAKAGTKKYRCTVMTKERGESKKSGWIVSKNITKETENILAIPKACLLTGSALGGRIKKLVEPNASSYGKDTTITGIEFTDAAPPENAKIVELSDSTKGVEVVGYLTGTVVKIYAYEKCEFEFENNYAYEAFINFGALKYIDFGDAKFPGCINLKSMFSKCESLESIDMRAFEPCSVASATRIFDGCKNLKKVILGKMDGYQDKISGLVFTGLNPEAVIYTSPEAKMWIQEKHLWEGAVDDTMFR